MYLPRELEAQLRTAVERFPVVAVTGPRQCGKSTLVRHVFGRDDHVVYLDLERPSDLRKLDDAEWFFSANKDKLICLDEIQRHPELFPLIRSLVDEWNRPGCFVVLGSASRDLLKQSSESLAGRIVYKRLTPFLWDEVREHYSLEDYLSSGGFPRSLLAGDAAGSFEWRESFISTFVERDLALWAGFAPRTMTLLWTMLAHVNGQATDYSRLASSLGVSSVSVKRYIDLLASTYMLEVVLPDVSNLGKRLVKSPRVYVADSGILTALLGLQTFNDLIGHPSYGSVWEQTVLRTIRGAVPDAEVTYYRTSHGAEMDFVVRFVGEGGHRHVIAVECKTSSASTLNQGNYNAIDDISPEHTYVVAQVRDRWSMAEGIDVVGLSDLAQALHVGQKGTTKEDF